jgi:DNA repair protein RecO (recombination protein O)
MSRPRVYKTEAIVLKRTNLGEADNIITLYTPNLGKIKAVAKGVRKPKSRLVGHLELLSRSNMLLAQGQNLDIITQSQIIESFRPLRDNLWRTGCAIYIAELIDQFTPEQVENYAVYRLVQSTLHWLCEARNNELVLRHFEIHLLSLMGYRPELYQCLTCRTDLRPQRNFFSARSGGTLCPDCARNEPLACPISVDALKTLRFLINNDHASASRLKIGADLSLELEQLLREYIRYVLEHEVKSVEFLDRLREEAVLKNQSAEVG